VALRTRGTPTRSRRARDPAIWFALPAIVVYLVVVIYPSLAGAVYAFTDWSGIGGAPNWVGLDNFKRLFTDDQSFGALRNTVLLTIFIVVVQNAVGLALALGVHAQIKSRYALRAIFFAPAVIAPVVIAFLWKYLLNPDPDSGINALLGFVGLGFLQQDWLGDPSLALWSVGFTVVWQYAGYSMVIFLAGLQSIPRDLYEAAVLDGAGRWAQFRHVTVPMLRPTLLFGAVITGIGYVQFFEEVFVMTEGGPLNSTLSLALYGYRQFSFGNYGYTAALAFILFISIALLTAVQFRVFRTDST
jgi:raffinose/stachyose/melibiose transport system permease protein